LRHWRGCIDDPFVTILGGELGATAKRIDQLTTDEIDIDRRILMARNVAFVLRCSAAAMLSYLLAAAIGLEHPVWAAISGIVVSQESLQATGRAAFWRLLGTLVGICVAVAAGIPLGLMASPPALQIGVSVAVCAMIARRWPDLKVAMWTAPIVYLTVAPGASLAEAGFWRGIEVLVGGTVGALLHALAELAINAFVRLQRRTSVGG
jgi:uncharacterized membrane protein YgaE (UPF0421/DUF939 family)